MNLKPQLSRALYRSLLKSAIKYQTDLQKHGSMELLLQQAAKAFFPFNRAELPDSRMDTHFASCVKHGHPRDYLRPKFDSGSEKDFRLHLHLRFLSSLLFFSHSEAFLRLRQLDVINKVKPQIAAMCAPVERPADLSFAQVGSSNGIKYFLENIFQKTREKIKKISLLIFFSKN